MRQKTEWGFIDWYYIPDSHNPKRWFSVGKSTVLPGKHQPAHVHYGNEQFLYVISGEIEAVFNGEKRILQPGDCISLEADTIHEAWNRSSLPYVEMIVTNPIPSFPGIKPGLTRTIRRNELDPEKDEHNRKKLRLAAQALKSGFAENISIPWCLVDSSEDVLLHGHSYPEYCSRICNPAEAPSQCACHHASLSEAVCDEHQNTLSWICPYGMKIFLLPLIRDDRLVGILYGGHHYSSAEQGISLSPALHPEVHYDTPYGTELSIYRVLEQMVHGVLSFCETLDAMEALNVRQEELNRSVQEKNILEKNIHTMEKQMTDLKVNRHFLFNTLNCLADMSLTGERMDMYTGIIDLSKLLRYILANNTDRILLSKEVEYLQSYLNLQKIRHKSNLSLTYKIDQNCLCTSVPFNFLQPVAENAFTHAFVNVEGLKKLALSIQKESEQIVITLRNNGTAPEPGASERITLGFQNGSGHGLSFVYDKLKRCYQNRFTMVLFVNELQETVVEIKIPAETDSGQLTQ